MLRLMFVVLVGLGTLANAAPAAAQEIFCTVTGSRNEKFPGDPGVPAANQIPVLFLTQEITRPFEPGSGFPSGVATQKPLIIVKELDASSIQFFLAAVTNERLKEVNCTFYRAFRSGGVGGGGIHGRAYFNITLTNANIVDYKNSGDGIDGTAPGDERERISLTYDHIELTDLDTNPHSSAGYSWLSGG